MSVMKVAVQANTLIELGKSLNLLGNWPYNVRTLSELLRAIRREGWQRDSAEQVG